MTASSLGIAVYAVAGLFTIGAAGVLLMALETGAERGVRVLLAVAFVVLVLIVVVLCAAGRDLTGVHG